MTDRELIALMASNIYPMVRIEGFSNKYGIAVDRAMELLKQVDKRLQEPQEAERGPHS